MNSIFVDGVIKACHCIGSEREVKNSSEQLCFCASTHMNEECAKYEYRSWDILGQDSIFSVMDSRHSRPS